MRNVVLIMALLITSIVSANELKYPDQVIWGTYCGECANNCSVMRKIDHSNLSIDSSDNFLKSSPFKYEFSGKSSTEQEFKQYQWILNEPIPSIINKSQIIFGQPDAYDQCGYFIDYRVNTKEYKVLIDPDNIPKEMKELVRKLFNESI